MNKTMDPTNKAMTDVAIIGAGTAGTFAAKQLNEAGLNCCIIEKSRGLGGRCSRRSVLDGFSVDLGASSFPIPYDTQPNLIDSIDQWVSSGVLTEWVFDSSDFINSSPAMKKIELSGTPSMNSFHRHLAAGTECLTQRHVHKLDRINGCWQLLDEAGALIVEAKAVVVTAPAEQTYNLVAPFNIVGRAEHDENPLLKASNASLPQYVCAITFDQPLTQLSDVYLGEHPVFSKIIRANSKPNKGSDNQQALPEVWVLHSSNDWAEQQQHQDANSVAVEMAALFCKHFNIADSQSTAGNSVSILTSHYWRLANHDHAAISNVFEPYKPDNQPFLWNQDLKLGCCADWLSGGGVIGALNSSQQLCSYITSQLKQEV